MGNSNCLRCCHEDVTKTDMSLSHAQIVNFTQTPQYSAREPTYAEAKEKELTQVKEIKMRISYNSMQSWNVAKLQALLRGCSERKKFVFLKSLSAPKHSFFSKNDLTVTLGKKLVELPLSFTLKVRTFTYPSGAVYTGEWFYGFRHGKGTIKWPNGCAFKGEWSFGLPFGQGSFTYMDKDSYSGHWGNLYSILPSKKDGYSWLAAKHEIIANFEENHEKILKEILAKHELNVKKLVRFKEKNRELVETIDFLEKIEVQQGLSYQGAVSSGKRHGFGRTTWENGDVYEGEWENDLQNGWGKNTWIDGSRYFGGYLNNNKHRIGEYYWEDGTVYVGEWKENNIDGLGKYLWSDGKEYIGEWKSGKMDGFGVFSWKDGRKHKGYWKNNKKHGIGLSCGSDGVIHKDYWINGKPVKN